MSLSHRVRFAYSLIVLLGGCGLFRPAPVPGPLEVLPSQVVAGLPSNTSALPPLPVGRNVDRTYSFTGTNGIFFSVDGTPETVRDELRGSLTQAGYTITTDVPQLNGYSLGFRKDGRLGTIIILTEAPERHRASFDLPGTFVEVRYDLAPPPQPVIPTVRKDERVSPLTPTRPPASAFPSSSVSGT